MTNSFKQLSDLLEIEHDPSRGNKFTKSHIIKILGFSKAAKGLNTSTSFTISNNFLEEVNKIIEFTKRELADGKVITLRFIDDGGERGGGYPVIYLSSHSDFENFFEFDCGGSFVKWHAIDGREIFPHPGLVVNAFTRNSSIRVNRCGFDNYFGETPITLGGGFRLQLDRFTNYEWQFTAVMVFNDVGPRVTGLSSEYEMEVPRITFKYTYPLIGHKNKLEIIQPEEYTKQENIDAIAKTVLDKMFYNDHLAIEKLFRALLYLRATERLHSLEGIFSIQQSDGRAIFVGPEILDFDGLDTLESWLKSE